MKNINIQKVKILSLLVLLSVTVITSLILTEQSQELRRGAVGQFKQYYEPATITNMKVGETRNVKIMVDTANEKIDMSTILFCYPKEFGMIDASKVKWGSSFDAYQSSVLKLNTNNSDLLCTKLDALIGYGGGEVKPSGLVEVATVTFTGVKAGIVSTLKDQVTDTVNGLKLQSGIFGTFTTGDTSNKSRFFDEVGSLNITMGASENTPVPPTNTPVPNATNTPVSPTNTPVPSKSDYILKFKVLIPGLWPEYRVDKCGKDFEKVDLIVESSVGTTLFVKDVGLKMLAETKDMGENKPNAVYQGQVSLTGFDHNENLSVVIKGVRHIGVRYSVNNQKDCKVGRIGRLGTLTKDESNTPIFDFTNFPLQPGDLNNDDIVNAVVNAQDFSLLKTAIAEGGTKKEYDLNGDCVLNSTDTNYLFQTLSVKCGDFY